jgi:hypothetical protein
MVSRVDEPGEIKPGEMRARAHSVLIGHAAKRTEQQHALVEAVAAAAACARRGDVR